MAISVEMAKPGQTMDERQRLIDAAREMVVCDPEILSGTPTIRGTRIPVYDVGALVASGEPLHEILDMYPGLSDAQVGLAAIYVKAFPYDGRTYGRTGPIPGAVLIHSKTVELDRKA